jgi:dihydroxyacetone kinase
LRQAIAGSSGPFYATALLRAASALPASGPATAQDWAAAFQAGIAAIAELGGAKPGDRTMLDALDPAARAFTGALERGLSPANAWADATASGAAGAEATRAMHPRLGRASYLGERAIGHVDAGAAAVVVWLRALAP